MRSLQSEIEQHGARIFELVDQHPESLFSKAGFYQRMMALSMRDEQFKVQMFRFVDVLLRAVDQRIHPATQRFRYGAAIYRRKKLRRCDENVA